MRGANRFIPWRPDLRKDPDHDNTKQGCKKTPDGYHVILIEDERNDIRDQESHAQPFHSPVTRYKWRDYGGYKIRDTTNPDQLPDTGGKFEQVMNVITHGHHFYRVNQEYTGNTN